MYGTYIPSFTTYSEESKSFQVTKRRDSETRHNCPSEKSKTEERINIQTKTEVNGRKDSVLTEQERDSEENRKCEDPQINPLQLPNTLARRKNDEVRL